MSPSPPMAAPTTPGKLSAKEKDDIKTTITMHVNNLEREWGIVLKLHAENESPSKRQKEPRTKEDHCVFMIIALVNRRIEVPPMEKFSESAEKLWTGWVHKPKAERGVVPERLRDSQHPLTDRERTEIVALLHDTLEKPYREFLAKNRNRPLQRTLSNQQVSTPHVNDTPLHFALSRPKSDPKRPREEQVVDIVSNYKKVKKPEARGSLTNTMPPPERGRSIVQANSFRSVNTSIDSNASSSIFSFQNPNRSFGQSGAPNTQETVPDVEDSSFKTHKNEPEEDPKFAETVAQGSSDYEVGSSFDAAIQAAVDVNGAILGNEVTSARIDDALSHDLMDFGIKKRLSTLTEDDILQDRLDDVFPKLPRALEKLSLRIMYEVTRVFCFTGVSMSNIRFPPNSDLEDYDVLWRTLRDHPSLQGKTFPPRSERAAWDAAHGNFTHENAGCVSGVVLGGTLMYNLENETGPLFRFNLKPMSLDKQHRLSRRFGDDRFLEFDMPHLRGNGSPAIVQADRSHQNLLKWLVNGPHSLLGRSWKPFHCKPKSRKDKKDRKNLKEANSSHCVYFFAVSGGMLKDRSQSQNPLDRERIVEIDDLLKMVRLTRKNTHQPYLKLFSRTSLAVSRNTPTVIFSCPEIRYRGDIEENGETMTDGAGRISFAAAQVVSGMLQNTYPPSGFQGRLGEAKGFWSVDYTDRTNLWIEVRASQCKWKRSSVRQDHHPDQHPSTRTFEVLKSSGPLKSADLNPQLFPLLMDRAKDQEKMKKALKDLMEVGLSSDLNKLRESMSDPVLLRKFVQERTPNTAERLRFGKVQFVAGLPSIDERLPMALDAGFDPYELKYVTELCRQLFKSKCDELKQRLNITVGKSTYAYMVPDFYGILEPDEVYMDFSFFTDGNSGAQGELLHGQELLVARSPAHFISDIQKVKAVAKVEFMGLKDVIIFPTKGNPSLAAKLSGGDYDGDLAWVCWEPLIVDNFVTADVPLMPDLVAEGYIHKDSTKYEDLVKERGTEAPVSFFLQKSLSFNMQQSMLGICTNWKDTFCYNQGSVSSKESIRLSTLLSSLVDQAKQGYTFGEDDWKRFKYDLSQGGNVRMTKPKYKQEKPSYHSKEKHIIDYLMYGAYLKVDDSLAEFEQGLPKESTNWDSDVAAFYKWAKNEAATEKDWKIILSDLKADLEPIKNSWGLTIHKANGDTEEKLDFQPILLDHFEKYQAVQPRIQTPITRLLLAASASTNLTQWSLLKASTLFAHFARSNPNFPWYMAGKQFCRLKAIWNSKGDPHTVVPSMYVNYKPDNVFIKQSLAKVSKYVENVGVSSVEELEEASQD